MKLGLALPWANRKVDPAVRRVQLAERLGFDSVWTAEAYGQDAITPLAFLAAHTRRIRLGTAVAQVAARPPAALGMAAATVDQLAGGGRVVLGLGLSGPQIVEGWYGQPWGRPNPRLRDYVTILRKVLRREGPVSHDGPEIALPYRGPGSSGLGKPLKCILHVEREIPIFLATGGRHNVALTAELADGWLPMGFVPGMLETYRPWLEEGAARAGRRVGDLEIQAGCQVEITDDVAGALRRIKSSTAFYVGGMGHATKNFHKDAMERRGYGEAAARIQELFLAGRREEAVDAVPDAYVDDGALVGPAERIRERFARWRDAGVAGLTLHTGQDEALELLADLAETRP